MNTFLEKLNKRYQSIDFDSQEVHDELIRELRTSEFAYESAIVRLIALHITARDVREMYANREKLLFGVMTIMDFCRHGKRETAIYHVEFHLIANITELVKKFSSFFKNVLKQFETAARPSRGLKQLKRPRVNVD